jgi:hypothetical protein
LGKLVIAWNRLHETLGLLFAEIIKAERQDASLAAWHSLDSDAAQRKMLRAATEVAFPLKRLERLKAPSAKKDVLAVVSEAEKLRDARNNAIHAPYAVTTAGRSEVGANFHFGHRRGIQLTKTLRGADLRSELKHYAATADAIAKQANRLTNALHRNGRQWPHKFPLPLRERVKSRKGNRQTIASAHQRRP